MKALIEAHARFTSLMVDPAVDVPFTLCLIDPATAALLVGVADLSPAHHSAVREIAGRAPFRIASFRAVRHANKQDHYRPLIGGIGIQCPDVAGVGTICVSAVSSGKSGFVTAGHVVDPVGTKAYQPRKSTVNDWLVGASTKVSSFKTSANSDSAFVQLPSGVTITPNAIWKASAATYTVTAVTDPALGTAVSMQGSASKTVERSGVIAGKGVTVTFVDGGTLVNQLLANYLSTEGDSGAPVYVKGAGDNVSLVGLNVGATEPAHTNPKPNEHTYPPAGGTYAIISPWAAIKVDLNLS
jgi:hypothetical protein